VDSVPVGISDFDSIVVLQESLHDGLWSYESNRIDGKSKPMMCVSIFIVDR
jgi:hypothetical protein